MNTPLETADAAQARPSRVWWSRLQRGVLGAAATVSAAALIVKATSAMKEIIVAQRFGTTEVLDAYLVALIIPAFAANVLASATTVAFIPAFVEVREKHSREAAQRLLSNTLGLATAMLLAMTLLLAVLSPWVLPLASSSFSEGKRNLSQELLFWLLPIVLFSGVNGILGGVLNSGGRFAAAALIPLATPAITIAFLAGAGRFGIGALVAGMVLGACAEFAVLVLFVRREGFSVRPGWSGLDPATGSALRQFGAIIVATLLGSGSVVVDQAMAASLGPGAVSALNYGSKVPAVLLSLSAGLWTAALPHFSKVAAQRDYGALRRMTRTYGAMILGIGIPATAVLYWVSGPMVRVLFQRGAFTAADTLAVSPVQACYVLQLPVYVLSMMYSRLSVSLRGGRGVMLGAALNLITNTVLDFAFMKWLGVRGIALSTACVSAVSCVYLGWLAHHRLRAEGADAAIASA